MPWDAKKDHILLIVWVDDVHCSVPPTADDQAVFHCIGLVCERLGPRTWRIHQRPYLEQVLERAGFVDGAGRPDDVPMTPSLKMSKKDCKKTQEEKINAF